MVTDPTKNLIIYPEDSSAIISKLTEKYNLKETPDDALEKMKRNEITNGEMLAGIVKEVAEKKVRLEDLPSFLRKYLKITEKNAKELTEDIKREILARIQESPVREEITIQKPNGPSLKKEENGRPETDFITLGEKR